MGKFCRCCGSSFQDHRCGRCGFPYINALDEAGEAELLKNIAEYKAGLLNNLTAFSVESHLYQWDAAHTALKLTATETTTITNGSGCLNRTIWSSESFGQYQDGGKPVHLSVSYLVQGRKQSLTVPITPVKTSGFWHVGMEIDDQLRLTVRLGDKDTCASSAPVLLALR